jgi:hypothetical protein
MVFVPFHLFVVRPARDRQESRIFFENRQICPGEETMKQALLPFFLEAIVQRRGTAVTCVRPPAASRSAD